MPRNGPRGGERFRAEWQPVIRLLWDELDKEHWKELAATAPVQASKSFGILVVPTLRDVCELGFSPIVGVPEADMFSDKWDKDFKPVLESSPDLQWMQPKVGSGSRGGRVKDRVTLQTLDGSEIDIKVMSRGGQATNKAGYTSARLRITEAAGFSSASQSDTDQEADAYRQLLGRLGAFSIKDRRRFVAIEGTGTVDEHLPWRLRGEDDDDELISSRTRIVAPCPHCQAFISPERQHLIGWQSARSVLEVLECARFACPECNRPIDDEQRRAAMQDARLVHYGQEIKPDGTITGPVPPTLRLWYRWSAFHNLLLPAGDSAVKEWEAAKIPEGTIDRDNAERDLCQKTWAVPYKSTLVETHEIKPKVICRRRGVWEQNILPPDTTHVSVGVDLGQYRSWWLVMAARANGSIYVPAYGKFNVCTDKTDEVSSHLRAALHELFDTKLDRGFRQADSVDYRLPDTVWVDRGWMKDDVLEVIRAYGSVRDNRYRAAKGFGVSRKPRNMAANSGTPYSSPNTRNRNEIWRGNRWHADLDVVDRIIKFNFDADYWKLRVHEMLRVKAGLKGSLVWYAGNDSNEHLEVSTHMEGDQLQPVAVPGKGIVMKWVNKGRNHWLDCAAMAAAGLDFLGFRLMNIPDPPPAETDDEETSEPDDDGNFYARLLRAA